MPLDREFYGQRTGDMTQFCGVRRSVILEGKGFGVETADLWNRRGIALTCYPGRGMDLGRMSYKGIPLSYHAKPGLTAPGYYESGGLNWLRGFFAGMLTTCGLSEVGGPDRTEHPVIGSVDLGLHGRISHAGAEDVCVHRGWDGDTYGVSVSGTVREACLHAENLTLTRTVSLKIDEPVVQIDDVIRNESCRPAPLMLLYHINAGYPLMDEGSRFFADVSETRPHSLAAQYDPAGWRVMGSPSDTPEKVYFHTPALNKDSWSVAGLYNEALQMAFTVRFQGLNHLTEWRMEGLGEYVLGIEPGNCNPIGRKAQEEARALEILPPWGEKHVKLELCVLEGQEAADMVKRHD